MGKSRMSVSQKFVVGLCASTRHSLVLCCDEKSQL
jgi:hypothetical protein